MKRGLATVQSLHCICERNKYGCKKLNSLKSKKESRYMCLSCGCGDVSNSHGDSRNITIQQIDEAAQAAGTTRERVMQNVVQGCQTASSSIRSAQARQGDYYQSQPLEKQSGRSPGEVSPEMGQDSGTAWQESQQMGETGRDGVQNPQRNP